MGLFKKKRQVPQNAGSETLPVDPQATGSPVDSANAELAQRRLDAYSTLGAVSDYVLAPLISEHLTGSAPKWPSREAHRVITTEDGFIVLATDGLTDQHSDGSPGPGYEIMTRVPAPAGGGAIQLEYARQLFEFSVQREMAWNALATWPDLRALIADNGPMSIVMPATLGASPFVADSAHGPQVGSLFTKAEIDGIDIIRVTHILPAELLALEAGGQETRPALVAALEQASVGWASIANREPVQI